VARVLGPAMNDLRCTHRTSRRDEPCGLPLVPSERFLGYLVHSQPPATPHYARPFRVPSSVVSVALPPAALSGADG
jgi:hypothetical protein